jgi:hypothetical protein
MSRNLLFMGLAALMTAFSACESTDPNALSTDKLKGNWLIVGLKKNGKDLGTARLDSMFVRFEENKLSSGLFQLIDPVKFADDLTYEIEGDKLKTEPELDIAVKSIAEKQMVLLLSGITPNNGGPAYDFELSLDRTQ